MARNRFRGRTQGARRETRWLDLVSTNTVLASGGATKILSLTAVELALRPFTIVRTHVSWFVRSDQAAASENYSAALGIAVVSDQANAIGITAIPTPVTDMVSDLWLLWAQTSGRVVFHDNTGVEEAGHGSQLIDSKAMRKVEDGQDIVVVIEEDAVIGTDAVTVSVTGRMLIKLH